MSSYIGRVRGISKLLKTRTDEIARIARMGQEYAQFYAKNRAAYTSY